MRWGLLLSDVAARLIGLFGLYCAYLMASSALSYDGGPTHNLYIPLSLAGFFTGMALIYLLPGLQDWALRHSLRFTGRVLFVFTSVIWLFFSVATFDGAREAGAGLLAPYLDDTGFYAVIGIVVGLFLIFYFPLGLSFREARAPTTPGAAPAAADKPTTEPASPYRRTDFWDLVICLPFTAMLLASIFASRYGKTVPSEPYLDWLDANFYPVFAGLAAVAVLPVFLAMWLRKPTSRQAQIGPVRRVLMTLVGVPLTTALLFGLVAFDGLPWAWNAATDNTDQTLRYKVTQTADKQADRGCIELLSVQGAPHRATYFQNRKLVACEIDGAQMDALYPGDIVLAAGELSWVGHDITSLTKPFYPRPSGF